MKKTNNENIVKIKNRIDTDRCTVAANPEMIRNSYEDGPCENN